MKAVGMRRTSLGWQVVELTIENGEIVKEVATEPEIRAVAVEYLIEKVDELWLE